ncbi:putative uncharacterized protein DDB_G0271606 [Cajanus cajan]|uniref:putative uncharacterized protein DDB_G0271606 n=1 Tax=Cajanus cajan TaxID=3821 RepID=UPI00098DCEAA|nr:putative uncharacterized protein DDB_G0271606 [Cajanus cajan]
MCGDWVAKRSMIDAVSCGALGDMTLAEVRHLIKKMASNSQQFSTRNDNAIVIRGVHNVATDADKKLESKLDALVNSGVNEHPEAYAANIYNRPHVQQQQQQSYDFSNNKYNPSWRNHPNLRWSNQQQQQPSLLFQNTPGPSRYVPPPVQQQQQRQHDVPAPPPTQPSTFYSSLEELVSQMTIQNMQFQQETRALISMSLWKSNNSRNLNRCNEPSRASSSSLLHKSVFKSEKKFVQEFQEAETSGVNEHPEAYAANIYNRPHVQQQQQQSYDFSNNKYNPSWRNHPNLRWSNQQQQQPSLLFQNTPGPSRYVPPPVQQQQQRQHDVPAPPPTQPSTFYSSLEELVSQMTIQNMQFQQETRALISMSLWKSNNSRSSELKCNVVS